MQRVLSDVRVPFKFSSDSLQSIRTLALRFLCWHAHVPASLAAHSAELLAKQHQHLFPYDSVKQLLEYERESFRLPGRLELKKHFTLACPAFLPYAKKHVAQFDIALTRELAFHHDESLSEETAYLVWFLAVKGDITFHSTGSTKKIEVGDVLVFDAQNIHALLRSDATQFTPYDDDDHSYQAVFAITAIPFDRRLRSAMGLSVEPVREDGYWRGMRDINYCEQSGAIKQ